MKGGSYFLDTNIFLRPIVSDDSAKSADCAALIAVIRSGRIHAETSHIVLAEIVWTLLSFYRFTKEEVLQAVNAIIAIPHLNIRDSINTLEALDMYAAKNVKFIDALIASHPKLAGGKMKIVSYDRDFDVLGVARVEPGDILKEK